MRESFYKRFLDDKSAVYFTEDVFGIKKDGKTDVTKQLQDAINQVKQNYGYGVVFIPEGKYLLSSTVYIPKAVRVIGYGNSRPQFILKDSAPGFNTPLEDDKGHFRYLFWFVNEMVTKETNLNENDANPGTFYSAMSNVEVLLGEGNDYAVAFRTHYAQHSFLAHIYIDVMSGMAGIYDVGNEMEDVEIVGGQYGIITTKCSPGWPFVMVDTVFENQKKAAIKTREAGLTIVRCHSKNSPRFVDVEAGFFEKLYIEDSVFEEIDILLDMAMDKNPMTQINLRKCYLGNVNKISVYKDSNKSVDNIKKNSFIREYVHGIMASDLNPCNLNIDEIDEIEKEIDYSILKTDLKQLPLMDKWINVKDAGLKGDGVSDDTRILNKLIKENDALYFPQGEYLLSGTIKLNKNTALIGMNPISTKFILKDNCEKFTGFGDGIGFIESADGGNNILFGIGIDSGGRNPRAIALKWLGSKESYINDVKLLGGHGNLVKGTGEFEMPYNETRTADIKPERLWDYQYPSVLVKGGGIFKDVWSASPYATCGFEVEDSNIESKVYCLSLEHHRRCEFRMKNSSNWTIYGFQSEEEIAEGEFARPIELIDCKKITFATTYHFRTIFVNTPYDYCVKTFNCRDIEFLNAHNFSQMKYTIDNYLLDVNSNTEIRTWQAAKIYISGLAKRKTMQLDEPVKLFKGFRFPDGGKSDNAGNFYFLDSLNKKVYKVDKDTFELSIVFESPYKVNSIGFDTENNIIIVGEYEIPLDATFNGNKQENILPADSYGTSYGFWYNQAATIVVFSLDKYNNIVNLKEVDMDSFKPEKALYPGNRWRDGSDFMDILSYDCKQAWLAPDGRTIIPKHYDLIRANNLSDAIPHKAFYSVDELYKRVVKCDVDEHGKLINPTTAVEDGDYCVRVKDENIFVGSDNVKVYLNANLKKVIEFDSRPITFDFGGDNNNILFATARDGIYVVSLKK